jgi:lysophospholipase L1-like esterase
LKWLTNGGQKSVSTLQLIFLPLLLLLACSKPAPLLKKLPDNAAILAFGDSLTYGTGASAQRDYPSILAQLTGHEVINEGVPGEISQQGKERLPALLDEYQPALLILIHGGNDILKKIPAAETYDNLKAMVAEARQRQIQVVILGVPEFGLLSLHSAPIYRQLADNEQLANDLETLPDILESRDLKSDAIHPNDAGYQKMAEAIARLLKEQGAL